MGLIAEERETIISWSDADKKVHVHTCMRPIITKILANPNAEILSDMKHDGSRIIDALLPEGSITIRVKAAGQIKRKTKIKRGAPTAQKCKAIKVDGKRCGSIAAKATGLCSKHAEKS
jgi:hypothetical protein